MGMLLACPLVMTICFDHDVIVKSQPQRVHATYATNNCVIIAKATMLSNALAWIDTQRSIMFKLLTRSSMSRPSLAKLHRGGIIRPFSITTKRGELFRGEG